MKTKPILIKSIIDEGNLDLSEAISTDQIIHEAANALDKSCSHEITGTVLFLGEDDVWYCGNVEFSIDPANKTYVMSELSNGFSECDNCGHIEHVDNLDAITDLEERTDKPLKHEPAGQCTVCGCLSYEITEKRARELTKKNKKA